MSGGVQNSAPVQTNASGFEQSTIIVHTGRYRKLDAAQDPASRMPTN